MSRSLRGRFSRLDIQSSDPGPPPPCSWGLIPSVVLINGGPDADADDEASPYVARILIPEVIPHVLKYLRITDIKQCRLVSKAWNHSATPLLNSPTSVSIEIYPEKESRRTWDWDEKLTFSQDNTHLEVVEFADYLPSDGTIFDVKISKCIFFMPAILKRLVLVFHNVVESRLHGFQEFLDEFLDKYSPSLEELSIEISMLYNKEKLDLKCPMFPALKSLSMCNHVIFDHSEFAILGLRLVHYDHMYDNRVGIDYKIRFPVLENLRVSTHSEDWYGMEFLTERKNEKNKNWGKKEYKNVKQKPGNKKVRKKHEREKKKEEENEKSMLPIVESVTKVEIIFDSWDEEETTWETSTMANIFTRMGKIFPNAKDSIIITRRFNVDDYHPYADDYLSMLG